MDKNSMFQPQQQEDRILKLLYEQRGYKKWSDVAEIMRSEYGILGRNGKQCRERYHNHLDDEISKAQWTPQEDQALLQLHNQLGNRWALIARQIKGRTDNCVKNRFYSRFRRSIRNVNELIKIFWKKKFKQLKPTFISKVIEITQEYRTTEEGDKKQIFQACENLKCRLLAYSDTTEEQLKSSEQNLNQLFELIKQINTFNRKNKRKGKKKKRDHSDYEDEGVLDNQTEGIGKMKKTTLKKEKIFHLPVAKLEPINNNISAQIVKQQTFSVPQIYRKKEIVTARAPSMPHLPHSPVDNSYEKRSTDYEKDFKLYQLELEPHAEIRSQEISKRKIETEHFLEQKFEDGFDVYEFYNMENGACNPHQLFY